MAHQYSLGIDFGSASCRAFLLDITASNEIAVDTQPYPSGEQGILLDSNDPHVARQDPADYLNCLQKAVSNVVIKAVSLGIDIKQIIGIGIDATASTPIPVDENMQPLCFRPEFKNNLNAYAWMWKDHTSVSESNAITDLARKIRPEFLKKCGGHYSSEWFFSKIWHCLNVDKTVFDAADNWIEFSDFIPATLAGIKNAHDVKRNICAAGHKGLFNKAWGGYPDEEFLGRLAPELAALRKKLPSQIYSFEETIGILCKDWADKTGLPQGIPIAVGSIDAHVGAIGAGISKSTLVKIIGTSACDIMLSPGSEKVPDIEGISGIVNDSVLPGYIGIEAGQSAFGDIYNWFVVKLLGKDESYHKHLTDEASKLNPGETGLLALDWNNGNRSILSDQDLTGLIVGQTINTRDHEVYRALIEATAFGANKIIERIEQSGVKINNVINCGGIAQKSPLTMQIFADITNRPIHVCDSTQTVALGAAIMGAYAALKGTPGFENIETTVTKLSSPSNTVYIPQPAQVNVYKQLYRLYCQLHDSFGVKGTAVDLSGIMKELIRIKKENS